jgi:hypothetical protein
MPLVHETKSLNFNALQCRLYAFAFARGNGRPKIERRFSTSPLFAA